MPMISVIVPIYKVEPYLRRCVDSILNQTFSDFELILVDDGSPDGCPAICDEYAQKDSRVRVIHQENGGLSAARNAGIDWAFANSDSEWLTFIDSDDWVHIKYLEKMLFVGEQAQTTICACCLRKVSDENVVHDATAVPTVWEICDVEEFLCNEYGLSTMAPTKIYRKELFQNLRYPVGKLHEDAFLTYRIFCQTKQISFFPEELYYYYQCESSIMNSPWTLRRLDNVDAHLEQLSYFKEHNYPRAYEARARYFAVLLTQSLFELKKIDDEDREKLIRKLRKEMRTLLKQNPAIFDINSDPGKGYYYLAYPTEMRVRRYFQRKIIAVRTVWKSKGFFGILEKLFRR